MVIWKYELVVADTQNIEMSPDAKLLCVQVQRDAPKLWALVDETREGKELRTIAIYGTGNPIPSNPGEYIDTFQLFDGSLVFHAFEVKTE